MSYHDKPLFPTDEDLCSSAPRWDPPPIKKWGAYKSVNRLLKIHIDLLSEEFIRTVRKQLDRFRENPEVRDGGDCYVVEVKELHGADVKVCFDPARYGWDEERRFLFHNLVFLFPMDMQGFTIGIVIQSEKEQLKKGNAVIKLIRGVCDARRGEFVELDPKPYLNKTFTLVESQCFYFPMLHVTNALRRDLRNSRRLAEFEDEIVRGSGWRPFQSAPYFNQFKKIPSSNQHNELNRKFKAIMSSMNFSQREALKSVLTHRTALVQGPPGTGKTYLGCKVAEYLLEIKKAYSHLLPGPILVVTRTNHSVREFLTRCMQFTHKVLHGYSEKHDKEEYGPLQEEYNMPMNYDKRRELMHGAHVLSMTTTRAAYIRATLDKLEIKIVIVEEAARELEGLLLASIPRGAQHLILLGDHKQLRPICQSLGHSHNLELSLFERLINNKAHCPMLNEQRRMRPEVADLIRGIYPTLEDHETTLGRPSIDGVDLEVPVFFIDHQQPEVESTGSGFYNPWEARMVAQLCQYLLVQGYPAEEITILAAYRKQIAYINKEIDNLRGTKLGIRVCTVDAFQGEENTIIILSLVRSNPEGNIGFLREDNRPCVALSRARDGFFLLGDLGCLTRKGAPVWSHVKATVRSGPALPLKCVHGGRSIEARSPEHFPVALCCVCRVHAAVLKAQAYLDWSRDLLDKTQDDILKLQYELETRDASPEDLKTLETLRRYRDEFKLRFKSWSSKVAEAQEVKENVNQWFLDGLVRVEDTDDTLKARILELRKQKESPASTEDPWRGVVMGNAVWSAWKSLKKCITKYYRP